MSETSPNLTLPYVQPSQAQKHVTVNESLRRLDAVAQLSALSRSIATPPTSPAEGDRYILPSGATGAWAAGDDHDIAAFQDGAWAFYPPGEGWLCQIGDEAELFAFRDGDWRRLPESENGASTRLAIIEIDHPVSAGASSDTSALIPDRAIVFAVSAVVLSDIAGAASFDLGVAGATDRYGTSVGVSAGTAGLD